MVRIERAPPRCLSSDTKQPPILTEVNKSFLLCCNVWQMANAVNFHQARGERERILTLCELISGILLKNQPLDIS